MSATPSIAMFGQHLLAFFLIVAGPVWDYFHSRPLKAQPTGVLRLGYYRYTMLWLWTASCVALWTTGWAALFSLRGLGIRGAWLAAHPWAWWTGAVLVALWILAQLVLPVAQVSWKYRPRIPGASSV